VTEQTTVPHPENTAPRRSGFPVGRTLVWLGIAGASAALTFVALRASMRRVPPTDETTERIQSLIEEANRLIKALDEKKPT